MSIAGNSYLSNVGIKYKELLGGKWLSTSILIVSLSVELSDAGRNSD